MHAPTAISDTMSIVIPTFNEAQALRSCIEAAVRCATTTAAAAAGSTGTTASGAGRATLRYIHQFVVSDGGSTDNTPELAAGLPAETWWPCSAAGPVELLIVRGEKGRGSQLQRGFKASSGSVLLFLHADTALSEGFDSAALRTLRMPGPGGTAVAAGAFQFAIEDRPSSGKAPTSTAHAYSGAACGCYGRVWEAIVQAQLAFLVWGTNIRASWLQLPYGDQCLFVTRSTLDAIGGYREDYPLLEDVELVHRLKKRVGQIVIAPLPAMTSSRRFRRYGVAYTTACNQYVLLRYWLGESPASLARWYYGEVAK